MNSYMECSNTQPRTCERGRSMRHFGKGLLKGLVLALAILGFPLVLVLAWDGTAALQQDKWYRSWLQRVQGWNLSSAPGLALAILGPALLAYWVLDLLASFRAANAANSSSDASAGGAT